MNNKLLQNKKFLLLIFIILIIILVLIFIFYISKPSSNNTIIIDNLDKYADVPAIQKDEIQKTLYSYITQQNQINNINNQKVYHGTIRGEPAQTTTKNTAGVDVYSINFILDIPELKYSYQTQFYWTEETQNDIDIDLGAAKIYCLSEEDSIYPDFNCNQNPAISTKTDSLLSVDMVINKDCWMSPFKSVESKSGYGVDIYYHPTNSDYKNNTTESSLDTCIKSAKQRLTSEGLNLNEYKIRSEIKYFYNY